MQQEVQNIYKTARETAGYTQEVAAELLGVSDSTVRKWESNVIVQIPDKRIVKMAKLYRCNSLVWQHLKTRTVFAEFIPDLTFEGLKGSVLDLLDSKNEFDELKNKLISILKDGIIQEHEVGEWRAVQTASENLLNALLSMIVQSK